jgi:hypothetical protein
VAQEADLNREVRYTCHLPRTNAVRRVRAVPGRAPSFIKNFAPLACFAFKNGKSIRHPVGKESTMPLFQWFGERLAGYGLQVDGDGREQKLDTEDDRQRGEHDCASGRRDVQAGKMNPFNATKHQPKQ